MKVRIINLTPLWVCANAIRYSHANHDKSDSLQINKNHNSQTKGTCRNCNEELKAIEDEMYKCPLCNETYTSETHIGYKDYNLIQRVGNKLKHKAILEFIQIQVELKDISRALLQEHARHRIASLCIKSTRYTLKELRNEKIKWFEADGSVTDEAIDRVNKYCILPEGLDSNQKIYMEVHLAKAIGAIAVSKMSNDQAKYMLPEAYKTGGQWSINMRSLQNYYKLRNSPEALPEIAKLAIQVANTLPEEYRKILQNS